MSCQELPEPRLWAYLDHELPAAERQALAQHVADCAICTARLEVFRQRPLALGAQHLIGPPAGFRQRVMARLSAEAPAAGPFRRLGWLTPLLAPQRLAAVTASALALALLSVTLVGAVLVVPVVEAAQPAASAPLANSMVQAMRQVLLPLGAFFQDWGWFILAAGMLATIMVPGVQVLIGSRQGRP